MGALLVWWLLLELLGLLALPLTLFIFRNLPDRGYPFARLVGILLPSFLAWFLGMWQLASYGPALLILCLLLLGLPLPFYHWACKLPPPRLCRRPTPGSLPRAETP